MGGITRSVRRIPCECATQNSVAAVVLRCRAYVPAIDAVWHPGTAFRGRFMQEKFGAGGSKSRFDIIKGSIEERFDQDPGIDPRGKQKIESCGGKRNQSAPQMHGKVGMDTAQSGERVIFERANGLFRLIRAMDVG